MPQPQHWAILGGGLLGMTVALRLAQQGQRVTLYESSKELGGLASAWQLGDITWDRHYHVTLLSDSNNRSLLRELGLEQELNWVETKTGFYTGSRMVSMSNSLEFLKFPPINLIDKARLALTILHASRIEDWKALERIPVEEWLRKWSGANTTDKIWLPLLRAKLGANYTKASAAFIWATIARMYAARRSGLKKEMFGYVPGGYARILARMQDVLQRAGVTIRLNSRVTSIRKTVHGLTVRFADGSTITPDQAIFTGPATTAADLCSELTPEETRLLRGIEYQGIICASLLLKRPLTPYYVTNITDPGLPFTAAIEMTALVDPKQFGGRHLIYLPKYVPVNDPMFEVTDAEIQQTFFNALKKMHPTLTDDDLLTFKVSRVRQVFVIPTLNYSQNLPPVTTSIPGLHILNSAHIVNGTLNVNDTVQLAERYIPRLLSQVPNRTRATYETVGKL
jgi:protoporphyrinogen oxidase